MSYDRLEKKRVQEKLVRHRASAPARRREQARLMAEERAQEERRRKERGRTKLNAFMDDLMEVLKKHKASIDGDEDGPIVWIENESWFSDNLIGPDADLKWWE